jgi:hypothetical protein
MPRCKSCGMSILNKNTTGFCNDKCKDIYKDIPNLTNGDPESAADLITMAIEKCFAGTGCLYSRNIEINRKFIKSRVVKTWCDTTNNFEHDKLIKQYEKFVRENAI